MARQSANYLLNSLKGKIWLATSALAFFICSFGLVSYLLVSLIVSDTFYAVFIPFIFLAFAVTVFGWWLSNEVVRPIEKVSLLAKSLERGVSISLPKTSGSTETDELLQTLHRNNQQLQNLVGLMDKVSSGNFDVALTPLQNSDRLSNSFQKLLSKVTESIHAKRDLERLQTAVRQISEEIARVKNGNFDVEIKSDFRQTKQITEGFKILIHQLNELIAHARAGSRQAQTIGGELQKTIQTIVGADENRVRELNQAKLTLKQIPQSVKKISDELFASATSASQSIERARDGSQAAQENLNAVGSLRRQIQEAVKRIGRLGERSQEIGKVAKTVGDFAQRTNMIALNASLQSAELGEKGRGFAVFAEEVERLAARAANMTKQISTLDKTITAEINEVENSLQESVGEVAILSKFAIETGNSLSELEKYIARFLNLQEKLVAYSGEQTVDAEKAFEIFIASIAETENAVKNLKESDAQTAVLLSSMGNLHASIADFKITSTSAEKDPPARTEKEPVYTETEQVLTEKEPMYTETKSLFIEKESLFVEKEPIYAEEIPIVEEFMPIIDAEIFTGFGEEQK